MLAFRLAVCAAAGIVAGPLVSVALTTGAALARLQVDSRPYLPAGSRVVGALPSTAPLAITVTLEARDAAALASYAAAVSTPGSGSYHHYLTVAEFRQRFGPTAAQVAAVRASLSAQGLDPGTVSPNGLSIPVSAAAGAIAHAFSLSFQRVDLANGRTAFANTQAPQLDASVKGIVQDVIGLNSLSPVRPLGLQTAHAATAPDPTDLVTGGLLPCTAAQNAAPANDAYTADQIASAYQFSGLYGAGDEGAGQTIALVELEPDNSSDIAAYKSCYGTTTPVGYVTVDGGAGEGAGSGEAALDIEDVIGLAPQASVLVYQGPPSSTGAYDTYSAIVSQDRANVISTSWGNCEADEETGTEEAENTLFQEAASQGQSIFAAAGDSGSEGCETDSLAVYDPASQPYVTGVGGTSLTALGPPPTQTVWNDECEGNPCGGGGGISTLWSMPSYQSGAPSWLSVINADSSGSPCRVASGSYCREVPDVSADADPHTGYLIYYDGNWTGIGGTSAAAPLWAAFTALVNASSGCAGNAIGFANPVLYKAAASGYASAFSDIMSGNNDITGTNGGEFAAGPGYNMASGLGTPIGSALPQALCSAASTVTATNPGNQTAVLGSVVNLPISAVDSDAAATLTYFATGLPAGLSIDASTGVISGTPTTAGSSSVTVTATNPSGGSGSASFTWTVATRSTGTALSCSPASVTVGDATSCTATVSDISAGSVSTPSGRMSFAGDGSGSFSGSQSCSLSQLSVGVAACQLNYTPSAVGAPKITASYAGDSAHQPSSDGFLLSVLAPSPRLPEITGTTKVGNVLTCQTGSSTSKPTALRFQWYRDGTPIVDATSPGYTVQLVDEGNTLTCSTTSPATAGPGALATSAGVSVPVPVVAGCPRATGRLTGTTLGLVGLGMTRAQAQKEAFIHDIHSSNGASSYQELFCLTPIGIQVGYAMPELLATLPAGTRRQLQGRVIWISTSSAYYATNGIRPGATLNAAALRLRIGRVFVIGLNDWYLAPTGRATAVLEVRDGIVQAIGIGEKQLTRGRLAQRALLTAFS